MMFNLHKPFDIFKRKVSRYARGELKSFYCGFPSEMQIDRMWAARDSQQGWNNVSRVGLYLAKRSVWENDPQADLTKVYAGFPTLGPKATPSNVIKELIKVYEAIRIGDYEVVENLDD